MKVKDEQRTDMGTDREAPEKSIPTNLRLLLLLEEIANAGVPMTPTAVNEELGLPKATVHRLFHRLEQEGYLQRDVDGRSFSAGSRLRKLAVNVLSSNRVGAVRQAVLTALARDIGETCNIATPDRDGMVYLDRVETEWPLRIQLPIGSTVPFHCTASGKMYLSTLAPRVLGKYLSSARLKPHSQHSLTTPAQIQKEIERVRVNGYATDDEEFMDGMVALAVPLIDDRGRMMSTLSVHAPTQRISLEGLTAHLDRLRRAAADLSEMVLR